MEIKETMQQLKTKQLDKLTKGKNALRYHNGKYQVLCTTCPGEKWVNVAEPYAERVAQQLLK